MNAAGDGTATASTSGTPRTTAGAPTITGITPGNNSLSVAFTAPSSDGGSAITNYKYSTDGGATFTAVSPTATTSPISISGLNNGTSYNVKILAVNAAGDGTASTTTAGTPQAPGTTYSGWLSGVGATPSDDKFWDYVYGAVAPGALDPSLKPTVSLISGQLVLTYYVREGAAGLNVKVKKSSALSSTGWTEITDPTYKYKEGSPSTATSTKASVQMWKAILPTGGLTKQFMRLEATETP